MKSNRNRGLVGKLMNSFTGPWKIIKKLHGSSYELQHRDTNASGKRHAAHLSPFPRELLPFIPIDGADNRYGQLNTPIQADPYKHAGIEGYRPSPPIKFVSINVGVCHDDIHFPSLSELNDELDDWSSMDIAALAEDPTLSITLDAFVTNIVNTRPLPPTAAPLTPHIPSLADLTSMLLRSDDKLFFISHRIPGASVTEWQLAQVDITTSLKNHPQAFQDGTFLMNFFTCHPSDKYFNASNQRYWLEYHPILEEPNPHRNRTTHLIRPSKDSPSYAIAEGLRPFRQWVRLTNADTYIAGPFNFAIINNRQSRDRISNDHWTLLNHFTHLFTNSVPDTTLQDYSVHYSQMHTEHHIPQHNQRIDAYHVSPTSPSSV